MSETDLKSSTIDLSQGYHAEIDESDMDLVAPYKWHSHGTRTAHIYARSNTGLLMHRLILDSPNGIMVDHIDGNTLNNRRSNLRLATKQQNNYNMRRSPNQQIGLFKGVHWDKSRSLWCAKSKFNGQMFNLGRFKHPQEAALVYDSFVRKQLGEFASCNYPDES